MKKNRPLITALAAVRAIIKCCFSKRRVSGRVRVTPMTMAMVPSDMKTEALSNVMPNIENSAAPSSPT